MKTSAVAWSLLLSALFVQAQNRSPQAHVEPQTNQQSTAPPASPQATAGAPKKIDPAKEADIRRLMDVAGTKALVTQTMNGMEQSIKPLLHSSLPPGEYRDNLVNLFFEKFRSKLDAQQLLDLGVPVYDKYLSDDEIKGLIQFYETPLGQKALNVLPKLVGELQEEGRKWGQNLGRDSMLEVLSEHPDLAQALEAAKKATQPQ